MNYLFKTVRSQKEERKTMEKIKVIIKYDLFKAIGLTVEKCSAYTEDSDSYVRINGAIVCNENGMRIIA